MGRHTCLYGLHVALGARMVDFGGWDMPVAYGSQIEEHQAVRQAAGVFDVSHMCIVDLTGARARELLRQLLSNDIGRLKRAGTALYSCMLNDAAGIIDDLLAYWLGEDHFRLVVNAATRDKDIAWIGAHAERVDVKLLERRDLAMLAVQGPQARERCVTLLPAESASAVMGLAPFSGLAVGSWFIARTGYTGEDGFEIMLPAGEAGVVWQRLNAAGVRSCGLGARDTLRLEAGLHLYGNDMDEQTHPLESGLAFTVAFDPPDRAFIGRSALQAIRTRGVERTLVGLILEERAVLRSHQRVVAPGLGDGEVTSGTFSPTLARSIGFARVPSGVGGQVEVQVRDRMLPARVVRPPFVRHGRVLVTL
ncbi:MAG TPA: glycine cleavage system aminomethyltransferase GcvT [Steroidobacteraceae bacterium]|nr:glycine cleavage system aminomethyltransferase GcvT [Steroidobacteraceae bacterium]